MTQFLTQNYLTRGFWGDEAWTSLISQLPYSQMLKTTAADFHPPGYYTVVSLFYKFLPATEIVTRSISILFYLLAGFIVYRIGKENFGRNFGLVAAVAVLVAPTFFTYAFEARNYSMFAFAAAGSIYFFLRLPRQFNLKNSLFFILFSTLGIYTHYYMFFTLAAEGLFLLLVGGHIFWKTLVLFFAIAFSYLPWVPLFLSQLKSVGQSYWISPINGRTHLEAFSRIVSGEQANIFQPVLLIFIVSLLLFGLFITLRKRLNSSEKNFFFLMWLWAALPFVLATLPGLKIDGFQLPLRPVFFWRYLIPSALPFTLLAVWSVWNLDKRWRGIFLGFLLLLSVSISFLSFQRYPYTFKQAYEEKIGPQIRGNDTIVTVLPSFAEVLYYRNRNNISNSLLVLPEGLVQYSGKSLLDAYEQMDIVKISERPKGRYFEAKPGPSVKLVDINGQ